MLNPTYKRTIICKYLSFYDPKLKQNFRLPLVHIRVKQGDVKFRTDALVDSGATSTFFPIEHIEVLGIKLPKKTTKALGAGGTFSTHPVKLDLIQVLKGTRSFCEFKDITVLVPIKAGLIPHTILGRDCLFRCYDITFRENREHIVFKKPKK